MLVIPLQLSTLGQKVAVTRAPILESCEKITCLRFSASQPTNRRQICTFGDEE